MKTPHLIHRLMPALVALMFILAIVLIDRLLGAYSWRDIVHAARSIPKQRLLGAIGVTLVSYFTLTFYDVLALQYIDRRIGFFKAAFVSFTAFSFTNNLGLGNLAGSSVRLRIYSAFGFGTGEIIKIILFVASTFWVGFLALAGAILLLFPPSAVNQLHVPEWLMRSIGGGCLLLVFGYVWLSGYKHVSFAVKGTRFSIPRRGLVLQQIMIGAADWALSALALYVLLPASQPSGYLGFLSIYISAQALALVSHVPGGIGVLEALIIYFVGADPANMPAVVGSLLMFRVIYYVLPLLLGATGLIVYEVLRKRHFFRNVLRPGSDSTADFLAK